MKTFTLIDDTLNSWPTASKQKLLSTLFSFSPDPLPDHPLPELELLTNALVDGVNVEHHLVKVGHVHHAGVGDLAIGKRNLVLKDL